MRKKKIVVIEDDPKTQRLISTILNAERYDLIPAADGDAGLDKVRLHLPDLVITDILLPRRDGYVILEIMKRERELRTIPVILLSAIYVSDLDRRRALDLGADHFLLKPDAFISRPFRANALLEAVQISLGEKRGPEPAPHPHRDKVILYAPADRDRRTLQRRLANADFDPLVVDRADELYQQVHLEEPAAAILDLDGADDPIALIAGLNAEEPAVALVVIAGPDPALDPVAALRAGAHDLHWKPLNLDLFEQRLGDVIQSHRLQIAQAQLTEQLKRTTTDLLDRIAHLENSRRRLQQEQRDLPAPSAAASQSPPVDLDQLAATIRRARRLVTESNDCGALLLDRLGSAERPLGQLLLDNIHRLERELDTLGTQIGRDVDPFMGQGLS